MATLTYTFKSAGGNATWSVWATHPTSPVTEALSSGIPTTTLGTGNKNVTAANNTWTLTGTWSSIFGLPNCTITGVTSASIQSKCTVFTTGGTTHTLNASTIVDGGTTITVGGTRSFTAVEGSFVTTNGTNSTGLTLASSDSITLTISNSLSNGSSNSATMALQQDTLTFTITYTPLPFTNLQDDLAAIKRSTGKFRIPDDDFTQNLLLGTLAPPPFISSASVDIFKRKSITIDDNDTQNLLVTTLVPVTTIFRSPISAHGKQSKPFTAYEFAAVNLLVTTLAVTAAVPFTPQPAEAISRKHAVVEAAPPNLLTSTLAPTVQLRVDITARVVKRKPSPAYFDQQQNLLVLAPVAAAAPFASGEYQVPFRRRSLVRDEPQNLLPNLVPPAVNAVFRVPLFQNVRSSFKTILHQDAANLLLSTLAPVAGNPFISSEYHVPVKRKFVVPTDRNNLLTSTLAVVQNPFIPFDYTVVTKRKFQPPEEPQNRLLTVAVPPFSSGDWQVTFKRPKFTVEEVQKNLLSVSQTLGFPASDYSVPIKRKFVQPDDPANLLPVTAKFPVFATDYTVLSKRKFVQPEDPQNLLLTAAVAPFVPADVPVLSKRRFFSPDDLQNLLPLTQTLGFPSGDWPVLLKQARIVQDIPPNLLVTTLVPANNPFPAGDWTVSYKRGLLPQQDAPNVLPLNTKPPFLSGESPYLIPRRKTVYYPDNAFNLPITNPLTKLPPGQSVYVDVGGRHKSLVEANPVNLLTSTLSVVTQNPFVPFDYSVQFARRRFVHQDAPNLLETTLRIQAPFISVDYNVPARKRFIEPEPTANLLLTAAVRPFSPAEFQYPVRRRFVAHIDAPNNLPVTQTLPFASGDYTVPIRHKFLSPEDVQNLLPLSQQLPFASGDWQVGYKRNFVVQVDVNNLLPLAISLVPFAPVEQVYPEPKRSRVPYETFTTFNLPTATFVQPFPVGSATEQYVFKPRSRVLPEVYINLLTSTLAPPVLVSDPAYTVSLDGINYTMSLEGVDYTVGATPVNYTAEAEGVNYTVGSRKPFLYTVRGKVSR